MKTTDIVNDWIILTDEEKMSFVKQLNEIPIKTKPQFFTLESDKNDCGGKFAEMSRLQVVNAARKAARSIMKHFSKK